MLSLDILYKTLDYDPLTGDFFRKSGKGGVKIGQKAGWKGKNKYWVISIDKHKYYAHHLAWYYIIGEWPSKDIDHKNTIKDDNRFINLRLATESQNGANSIISKNNKSGYKGVFWDNIRKKWQAKIKKNRKSYFLGRYFKIEDAINAYNKKALEFFGEFARYEEV